MPKRRLHLIEVPKINKIAYCLTDVNCKEYYKYGELKDYNNIEKLFNLKDSIPENKKKVGRFYIELGN